MNIFGLYLPSYNLNVTSGLPMTWRHTGQRQKHIYKA